MWKDYSVEFIRKNKISSISIGSAALISALFLSLLCSLAFNFWTYELESIMLEEGDWQGRVTGALDEKDLQLIEELANVDKAVMNQDLSGPDIRTVDIYFKNMRTAYQDMELVAERLGRDRVEISCHEVLLSRYLIHNPADETPPLLMSFYLGVLLLAALSLILIIHHSFAVSMNERIHQFGIFSSVGATPGQIRACLIQEASALCALPILAGSLAGIGISKGVLWALNQMAAQVSGRHEASFSYHPLLFVLTLLASAVTVLVSAWFPAVKLSRLTPLQAIRGTEEAAFKKKKHIRILPLMFGIEGELAENALRTRKKAFRTSALSLTLSFLAFTLMQCFFTLSGISTRHTYFERFQDAWDVMVTVKDTDLEGFQKAQEIRQLQGVKDVLLYQKGAGVCLLPEAAQSRELKELGGLQAVAGSAAAFSEGEYRLKAPVIVMDDESFREYCRQTEAAPDSTGSIVLNRIWDSVHSNFRYKKYIPFIREDCTSITLETAPGADAGQHPNEEQHFGGEQYPEKAALEKEAGTGKKEDGRNHRMEIQVLACTEEAPVLREEYDNYGLVQFVPLSLWKQISGQMESREKDLYIRVLAKQGADAEALQALEEEIAAILEPDFTFETENRIQERIDNDKMIQGFLVIIGSFCILLAIIGIANVFSNTIGFLSQRKREFARYASLGMTPGEMRKILCMEALVTAGRPLLITAPLTALLVWLMITASYLNPAEFMAEVPWMPVLSFILGIFGFVALAYYIGGRRLFQCSLADALREESIS